MLRIRLLGGVALEVDGRAADAPASRRLLSLLAWLALNPGMQPRSRLAARFWPDVLDTSARGSLRNAVLELRRAMAPDAERYLIATRDAVGLGPDEEVWVDMREFERAVSEGRSQDALALGEEELLPELDDDWVFEAREAHAHTLAGLLERAAAEAEEAGELGAAIEYAHRLVGLDPLGEEPARRLMRLLAAAGERAAALGVYERLRERLRADLKMAPSAATRELAEGVRAGPPVGAGTATGVPSPGVVAVLVTDIVRSTELLQELGDAATDRLTHARLGQLRELALAEGGQEVKSFADGLSVVFQSPADSVGCAVAIQRSMDRQTDLEGWQRAEIRVGLNVGEPIRFDDGYSGSAVTLAKRLCEVARPGQIVASQLVRGLVEPRGGYRFENLGTIECEGFPEPVAAFEVNWQPDPDEVIQLPPSLERIAEAPLFGRGAETRRLREEWQHARSAGPRCVVLAGEPGIGKTALIADLCRDANMEGATVMYGSCHEEALVSYEPFVEALRGYVLACPGDRLRVEAGAVRGWLTRLVPELAELAPGPEARLGGPAESERLRLFEAVATFLDRASHSAALVLALDDLHWADVPTLQLLEHVVRSVRDSPIFVLATYRDTEAAGDHQLERTLARLRRERVLKRLSLEGLDKSAVGELMAISADSASAPGLVHAVFERTDGNPFFVEEMVRDLGEAISAPYADAAIAELGVPESVKDLIDRRIARLEEVASGAVAIASVIGREFDLDTLEALMEVPRHDLVDALDEAVATSVVVELPTGPGSYSFAHALVRETLYERLSATRRGLLHSDLGKAIEERFAGRLEGRYATLAHHFTRAGDAEKALRYHEFAGHAAARVYAHDDALLSYSNAIDAAQRCGRGDADPIVYGLRQRRGWVRYLSGDIAGALSDLEAAIAGSRSAGDTRAELEALSAWGTAGRSQDFGAAVEGYQAALRLAESLSDVRAQVTQLSRLGLVHSQALRLDTASRSSERALELARSAQDDEAVVLALDSVKRTALELGQLRRLDAATRELLELRERTNEGSPLEWAGDWVLLERSFVAIAEARFDEALASLIEAIEVNRRHGFRHAEPIFLDALCWTYRSRGDHEHAISAGVKALELAQRLGADEWRAWTAATLGWALLESGDCERAADPLEHGLAAAEAVGARAQVVRCAALLGWACWETGHLDKALSLTERAESLLAEITTPPGGAWLFGAHAQLAVARVWLASEEPERAGRLLEPLLTAAREAGWHETIATATLLTGRSRAARGDPQGGAEMIDAALELARTAGLHAAAREATAALAGDL
jgi:predicted ATPase/DNA-binding SARP family transcriptional activator